MTDEDRIAELERQLVETKQAAADMFAQTIAELVESSASRASIADAFERYAATEDDSSARAELSRMIAANLREALD